MEIAMYTFEQERMSDSADITSLLNTVFGPDRKNKASYALRQSVAPIAPLCMVARSDAAIVATIRFWPVLVRDLITGSAEQALLLGPLAVDPLLQGHGVGSLLIEQTLEKAAGLGHERILLVGEQCYYGRFGFVPVLPSFITLPGGRDARRLLVKQSARLSSLPAVGKLERFGDAPVRVSQKASLTMPGKATLPDRAAFAT